MIQREPAGFLATEAEVSACVWRVTDEGLFSADLMLYGIA